MKQIKDKKLIKAGSRLAVSICFLAISLIMTVSAAFAWFIINDSTSILDFGSGVTTYSVDIYSKMDVDGDWTKYVGTEIDCSFENLFCGAANSRTVSLKCKNNSLKNLTSSWYFNVPSDGYGEEIPLVITGGDGIPYYYYLGSQIQISNIQISVDGADVDLSGYENDETFGKNKYLVSTALMDSEDVGAGQVTAITYEQSVAVENSLSYLDIINNLMLMSGTETEITLTFTFVDNGENQNAYQSFAGSCKRSLAVSLK